MSEPARMFMRYCVLAERLLAGKPLSRDELAEYEELKRALFD